VQRPVQTQQALGICNQLRDPRLREQLLPSRRRTSSRPCTRSIRDPPVPSPVIPQVSGRNPGAPCTWITSTSTTPAYPGSRALVVAAASPSCSHSSRLAPPQSSSSPPPPRPPREPRGAHGGDRHWSSRRYEISASPRPGMPSVLHSQPFPSRRAS